VTACTVALREFVLAGFACRLLVAHALLGDTTSPLLELLAPERFEG
jgi:hypothetical protein